MALHRTLALAALVFSSQLMPSSPTMADDLTLERIFASPALDGPTLRSVRLAPDGSRVTFLRGSDEDRDRLDLWAYDPATDTTGMLIAANDVLAEPAALSEEEEARREFGGSRPSGGGKTQCTRLHRGKGQLFAIRRRKAPVWLVRLFAIAAGGPSATTLPPMSPPSGPRSITQSAHLITSRLCSITTSV